MKKDRGKVVGFVVTPSAIAARIEALDNQIAVLDGDIRASTHKSVNGSFRAEWDAFLRRWAVERDSYKDYGARLFATYVMPRLDAFEASYRWWASDFERRTGKRPNVAPKRPAEGLFESLLPENSAMALGLILGAAALYFWGSRGR